MVLLGKINSKGYRIMKISVVLPLLISSAFAGLIQTNDGAYLELFAKRNSTELIAKVPVFRGSIDAKSCYKDRTNTTWCRTIYKDGSMQIIGFSEKKYIDKINQVHNKQPFFKKRFGGRYDEEARDVLVLDDGFLIVGYTKSFGHGNEDVYVLKTDEYGNKIYSKAYGGSDSDIANAVTKTPDGFMIAGTTKSFGNRVQNLYVARLRDDGGLYWQRGFYSDGDDYYEGNDITPVSKTNFLIAGQEDHVEFFNSEKNIYVNAVNIKGKRNGIKYYGGKDDERANSIITTKDGYTIAGETDTWGHGDKDAYVLHIDKKGKKLWHNAFGMKYDEVARQIIQTSDGGYILVGSSESDTRNRDNIFVAKIDAKGGLEWQYLYGTPEDDGGYGIVEVKDGYVIAGYTEHTKGYDKDLYLLKISKDGDTVWSRQYGGVKDDEARAIKKTKDGFVVVGYTQTIGGLSKDLYILKVNRKGLME